MAELREYRLKREECVYIRSMGRALRVVAICPDAETANALMQIDRDLAVVASFAGDTRVYLASQYDRGIVIPREGE